MLSKIVQANLQRTRHLLHSYHMYKQCENEDVDVHTSQLILAVLAENMADKADATPRQYQMLDKCGCGGSLCKGIDSALDVLKSYPEENGRLAYVVLFEQYLHPHGPAVSLKQLQERLRQCDTEISIDEIQSYLAMGEQMATALLFENKILYASIMALLVLPDDVKRG